MTTKRFFRTLLRTLDEPSARAFYAPVLGVEAASLNVVPLHEGAIARGARPHWIGFIEVPEVASAAAFFAQRGAVPLGPPWVNPEGLQAAVMRDPGGAIVALARPPPGGVRQDAQEVASYVLNTKDAEAAKQHYGELLGWSFGAPSDVGGQTTYPFSWSAGGPQVGAVCDLGRRPQVPPHWLFHFRVRELAPALEAVRTRGGAVAEELAFPTGERAAVCEDPQGAAFALRGG